MSGSERVKAHRERRVGQGVLTAARRARRVFRRAWSGKWKISAREGAEGAEARFAPRTESGWRMAEGEKAERLNPCQRVLAGKTALSSPKGEMSGSERVKF